MKLLAAFSLTSALIAASPVSLLKAQEKYEIVIQSGHSTSNWMSQVDISSDGLYLVSSSSGDPVAKLWHIPTGREMRSYGKKGVGIHRVKLSPNLQYVAACSYDGSINVWETATGRLLMTIDTQARNAKDLAFSPDNQKVAVAVDLFNDDRTKNGVIIYQISTGAVVNSFFSHSNKVSSVQYSPCGGMIISSSWDNSAIVYDAVSGKIKKKISMPDIVNMAIFSKTGKQIGLCTSKGLVRVIDALTWKTVREFQQENATFIEFSPDGKTIAASNQKYIQLYFYNIETGQTTKHIPLYTGNIKFLPDRKSFVTPMNGGNDYAALWDLSSFKIYRVFKGRTYEVKDFSFIYDYPLIQKIGYKPVPKKVQQAPFVPDRIVDSKPKEISFAPENPKLISDKKVFFSLDSAYKATASHPDYYDNPVIQISDKTGKSISEIDLRGYGYEARIFDFTPDNRFVLIGDRSGYVKLFSTANGKELATIVGLPNNEYAIVLPNGYYYATPKIHARVSMVKGMEVFGLENFDLKYNRPDIVLEHLGCTDFNLTKQYLAAWQKRIQKMGLKDVSMVEGAALPRIEIQNLPHISTSKSLKIDLQANDDQFKLIRCNLYVNEVPVWGSMGMELNVDKGQPFVTSMNIELSNGVNRIQASVVNELGIESFREIREVFYNGHQVVPDLYVISVGVSEFLENEFNLKYAAKDAHDVLNLFTNEMGDHIVLTLDSLRALEYSKRIPNNVYRSISPDRFYKTEADFFSTIKSEIGEVGLNDYGDVLRNASYSLKYKNKFSIRITNADATREKILEVKNMLQKTKPDDVVIFFVASHGLVDSNLDYYIATHDVDFSNPRQRGLKFDDLEAILDSIPSRKKVLILDACHSGEIDKEEFSFASNQFEGGQVITRGFKSVSQGVHVSTHNSFEIMKFLFNDFRRGSGTIIVAASGGAEFAFESDSYKNGVFTYAISEGLSIYLDKMFSVSKHIKADRNDDKMVTVSELFEYVFSRVHELTQGMQNPTSRQENLEFDFRVW